MTRLIAEPFLTADLEPTEDQQPVAVEVYFPAVLRSLAAQLTVSNDFYYPLIGAANLIEDRNR